MAAFYAAEMVGTHTSDVGLDGKPDAEMFAYAQVHACLVVTFDEHFADLRSFPVGQHHGVVRLRVWPTTIEETQSALARLLEQVTEDELRGALVVIDRQRIRIRSSSSGYPRP
jgi:predicted nuclease of predicted toxin-antitoxin system